MRGIFIGSAVVGLLALSSVATQAGDLAIASAPKAVAPSNLSSSLQLCTPVGMGMLHLPPVLTCFQMGSSALSGLQSSFAVPSSMSRMSSALVAMPRADDPTSGWNLTAFMSHQWTDRLRSEIGVRHIQLDSLRGEALRVTDTQVTAASAGVSYSFFRGFDIGLEFQYANLRSKLGTLNLTSPLPGAPGEERNISTRLRVDRAF
jgi:hypothetical protein